MVRIQIVQTLIYSYHFSFFIFFKITLQVYLIQLLDKNLIQIQHMDSLLALEWLLLFIKLLNFILILSSTNTTLSLMTLASVFCVCYNFYYFYVFFLCICKKGRSSFLFLTFYYQMGINHCYPIQITSTSDSVTISWKHSVPYCAITRMNISYFKTGDMSTFQSFEVINLAQANTLSGLCDQVYNIITT